MWMDPSFSAQSVSLLRHWYLSLVNHFWHEVSQQVVKWHKERCHYIERGWHGAMFLWEGQALATAKGVYKSPIIKTELFLPK